MKRRFAWVVLIFLILAALYVVYFIKTDEWTKYKDEVPPIKYAKLVAEDVGYDLSLYNEPEVSTKHGQWHFYFKYTGLSTNGSDFEVLVHPKHGIARTGKLDK